MKEARALSSLYSGTPSVCTMNALGESPNIPAMNREGRSSGFNRSEWLEFRNNDSSPLGLANNHLMTK